MSSETSLDSPAPLPGAWVDKLTGLPVQLIAVQQSDCWYQTSRSMNFHPMPVAQWLKEMRPA
jgi:hypothetical protein